MANFRLRIADADLLHWASYYSYPGDAEIEERIASSRGLRYLTREEFLRALWQYSKERQP